MKMRFPIAVLMITLIFVWVLPLVRADSGTIVYHKVLQSDDEHFYVSVYVYKATDSLPTEDFYGVKIHVHGVDGDYGSFNYIWVTIKSYNGITDYWEPVAAYYSGGSIGFGYYGISFSIDIPTEWVGTEGGFTDYIKWGKNMFFTHDDMCSAGFYVPEAAGFNFEITVKAEHCELPPSGSPWIDQCSIIEPPHTSPHTLSISVNRAEGGTVDPAPGTYFYDCGEVVTVTAYPAVEWGFKFKWWILDGTPKAGQDVSWYNQITVTMDSDHTLQACFGVCGGSGCPTLFVWNGSSYESEGILNIHAESDVTVQHTIENTLALEGTYNLQLRELDNHTSHIDQVRLYAVDYEGEWHLCPLTYAIHNELGKVKQILRFDDSNRVDLKPTETISLKFAPSISYDKTVQFTFEINGYNMKIP